MVRKANVKPIPHKNGSVRKWPDLGSGDQSETLAEMHTLALGVESAVSSGLNLNAKCTSNSQKLRGSKRGWESDHLTRVGSNCHLAVSHHQLTCGLSLGFTHFNALEPARA